MLMCGIVIIQDHKMKQILNDFPKIIPELYLSSSIIKNAFILSHHQRSHTCMALYAQ